VFRLQESLQESVGTDRIEVAHGQFNFLDQGQSRRAVRYLQIGAYYSKRIESFEDTADAVAAVALADPAASA
jgi:hypothetical protein